MASIVVIGTEGSGKTVFATVMAKLLHNNAQYGCILDPQTRNTLDYVAHNWQTLQSGEWPPSTQAGTAVELHWRLNAKNIPPADIRIVDASGQDLRDLFGAEKITKQLEPNTRRQQLAEVCLAADIVIFLLNLQEFVGQTDEQAKREAEWTVKFALDTLRASPRRRVCLVFTQADQIDPEIAQTPPVVQSRYAENAPVQSLPSPPSSAFWSSRWDQLAKQHVPHVYAAHIGHAQVPVFVTAAVARTVVTMDDDGKLRRKPAPGFFSIGLESVAEWIHSSLLSIQDVHSQERRRRRAATVALHLGFVVLSGVLAGLITLVFRDQIVRSNTSMGMEWNWELLRPDVVWHVNHDAVRWNSFWLWFGGFAILFAVLEVGRFIVSRLLLRRRPSLVPPPTEEKKT